MTDGDRNRFVDLLGDLAAAIDRGEQLDPEVDLALRNLVRAAMDRTVSVSGFASMINVTRQYAGRRLKMKDAPDPIVGRANLDLWWPSDIRAWLREIQPKGWAGE